MFRPAPPRANTSPCWAAGRPRGSCAAMTTTLANCSYDLSEALTLGEHIVNSDFAMNIVFGVYACTPFKWEYLVNLCSVFVWLIIARWMYDGYMRLRRRGATPSFRLYEELTKRDNPALAIDFAAFLFSICLIMRGSLAELEPAIDNAEYFGQFFAYQAVGCFVIVMTRFINDKLLLRQVRV